ncbi:MAG: ATP-binding cassette domain-containing protein [Actinomycetia bacterium]|nr:ATP-binding cassette domain-containing protein [Actinomycetes bacterium]
MRGLNVQYGSGRGAHKVINDLSLSIATGQVLGLVGESGSGKSTVARGLLGLTTATGAVAVGGQILHTKPAIRRARNIQMIFQDPYASLNPRMTIGAIIAEALVVRPELGRAERRAEVSRLLELVLLDPDVTDRLPGQLSGGQRQRVAIARALAASPKVIVADEITSALDVSVQAQVLNVLRGVLRHEQLSVLFISHSLAVVRYISDHIAVMHDGRIVETGATEDVITAPQHPYTRALLAAVPTLDGAPIQDTSWLPIAGPQEAGPLATGCPYRARCPVGPAARDDRSDCATVDPALDAAGRVNQATCLFARPRR